MSGGFMLLVLLVVVVILGAVFCPCRFGLHRWDFPGGHCKDCGRRDNFFDGF